MANDQGQGNFEVTEKVQNGDGEDIKVTTSFNGNEEEIEALHDAYVGNKNSGGDPSTNHKGPKAGGSGCPECDAKGSRPKA